MRQDTTAYLNVNMATLFFFFSSLYWVFVAAQRGYSLVSVQELLIAVTRLVAEHGL